MTNKRGFTLIELLIVLGITAIVSVIFIKLILTGVNYFRLGQQELVGVSQAQEVNPIISSRISTSKEINDVSLLSSDTGFIDYTDQEGLRVKVFYNNINNQQSFAANNSFGEDSIVAIFSEGNDQSEPELLVSKVTSFNIETYKQDPAYFRIASPSNVTSPNLDSINSVKISFSKKGKINLTKVDYLIGIYKTELEKDGEKIYGKSDSLFVNQVGFTYTNIDIQDSDGSVSDDGLSLDAELKTVKIQNTGLYYDSISEAVDEANFGDTILVARRETPYEEVVSLKSGLTIIGGYNVESWTRDLTLNNTEITPSTGFLNTTFYIDNSEGVVIDGFDIIGKSFKYGIYCEDSKGILIKNCTIENTDRGIQFLRAQGRIENNNVTANEHTLFISDSEDGVTIQRNRLFSTNLVQEENLRIFGSKEVTLKNNIIKGGYNALAIEQSINSYVYNNIITFADNLGIHVKESTSLEIYNNVISRHTLGILLEYDSPPLDPLILVKNNLFVNISFLSVTGMTLDPGDLNQETQISDLNWTTNNPYFFDITNFLPQGNAATSILIDKGINTVLFQDRASPENATEADTPSIENVQNDIGAYGGPSAGRIGIATVQRLDPDDSESTWANTLRAAFPGDIIIFPNGEYLFSDTVILKKGVMVYGEGHSNTIIKNNSPSVLFQLKGDNKLADLQINGDENPGIELVSESPSDIRNLLVYNCSLGLTLDDGASNIHFSVFDSNEVDITIDGSSRASVNYSILSHSEVGINHIGGTQAFGQYNVFYGGDTYFNGNYASDSDVFKDASEIVFWDHLQHIYQLHPSSDIININENSDPGVEEYFEFVGQVDTSVISSELFRVYKEISLSLGGRSDLSADISSIEVALLSDEQVVTLSEAIVVTQNSEQELKWTLPITSISKEIKVRLKVTSYTVNHSPFINDIRISW
jgi:prepilin-type N-terminal cleavage/methylation domain-containing protein